MKQAGPSQQACWISWQHHRRTDTICSSLNIPLYVLISKRVGWLRYLLLSVRTGFLLFRVRPSTLIVQNPSIVLCVLASVLRPLLRYKLIVDAHNEGVQPYKNRFFLFDRVTKWLHRKATFTVVTNTELGEIVSANGGRALVVPDGLPKFEAVPAEITANGLKLVLISSFADDEPIEEVFNAFTRLTMCATLHVTGNASKLDDEFKRAIPNNVKLRGFLSEHDYFALLRGADAVIDLSNRPNCLVCGAYEAISLGRPVVLADDPAGRALFEKGVLFTRLDEDSILATLEDLAASLPSWQRQAEEMKALYSARWQSWAERLAEAL